MLSRQMDREGWCRVWESPLKRGPLGFLGHVERSSTNKMGWGPGAKCSGYPSPGFQCPWHELISAMYLSSHSVLIYSSHSSHHWHHIKGSLQLILSTVSHFSFESTALSGSTPLVVSGTPNFVFTWHPVFRSLCSKPHGYREALPTPE